MDPARPDLSGGAPLDQVPRHGRAWEQDAPDEDGRVGEPERRMTKHPIEMMAWISTLAAVATLLATAAHSLPL